jgi:hypothetical protein
LNKLYKSEENRLDSVVLFDDADPLVGQAAVTA